MSTIKTIQARIEALSKKEDRTRKEAVSLATAHSKIEDKSPSKLWRKIQESPYALEIYGGDALPSFAEWLTELSSKPTKSGFFSEFNAFQALARIGTANLADKAEKVLKRALKQQQATEAI